MPLRRWGAPVSLLARAGYRLVARGGVRGAEARDVKLLARDVERAQKAAQKASEPRQTDTRAVTCRVVSSW